MTDRNQDRFWANNAFFGYRHGAWDHPFNNGSYTIIMGEVRSWYHGNITSIYRDRLEDTIYCNDRRIAVGDTGINTLNIYEGHNRLIDKRIDLTCTQNDSYTVSTEIGNGALPEPIAMLTLDELMLAGLGESSYLNTGETWWTMTADQLVSGGKGYLFVASNGMADRGQMDHIHGVRPSVSLKPHIVVWDGDGSEEDPYIIP